MERRWSEKIGRTVGVAILVLGALAAEGCGQKGSVPVDAATLPAGSFQEQHFTHCKSEGSLTGKVLDEVNRQSVQDEVAGRFQKKAEDIVGLTVVVKVDNCDAPVGNLSKDGLYQKITVSDVSDALSHEGHCVVVPVAEMAVPVPSGLIVAECVQ